MANKRNKKKARKKSKRKATAPNGSKPRQPLTREELLRAAARKQQERNQASAGEALRRRRAAEQRLRSEAQARRDQAAEQQRRKAAAKARSNAEDRAQSTDANTLSRELRRACEKRLLYEWHSLNYAHLREKLRPPVIELEVAETRWGSWTEATRTLGIAERLVMEHPWGAVLDVLRHEMAHQVVSELLRPGAVLPHGEAFRRACAMLAADPSASGDPSAVRDTAELDPVEARQLRRIRGLLALAESENQHEAEAALAKANELLLKYNLELARTESARGYVVAIIGGSFRRRPKHVKLLAGIVTRHFFCEAIWLDHFDVHTGKTVKVLEICGTKENTELASYVWDEVLRSAENLWKRHKLDQGIRADKHRRRFTEGVVAGYGERLRKERARLAEERALVWLGDPKLEAFYRQRNPRITSETVKVFGGSAFEAGRDAGASLRITRGVSHHHGDGGKQLTG